MTLSIQPRLTHLFHRSLVNAFLQMTQSTAHWIYGTPMSSLSKNLPKGRHDSPRLVLTNLKALGSLLTHLSDYKTA